MKNFNFVKIPEKDYEFQTTLVTRAVWKEIIGNDPSYFKEDWDCPVEMVSFNDIMDFLSKINESQKEYVYRLPSEEEWENACRAGSTTNYYFGDDVNQLKDYAWFSENSYGKTRPVGLKKPNNFGLYDMHGNVCEWTKTMEFNNRVLRGGSWFSCAQFLRSANRYYDAPDLRFNNVGFRLVREKVKLDYVTEKSTQNKIKNHSEFKKPKFIHLASSKDSLFGLDSEGFVWKYTNNGWLKIHKFLESYSENKKGVKNVNRAK